MLVHGEKPSSLKGRATTAIVKTMAVIRFTHMDFSSAKRSYGYKYHHCNILSRKRGTENMIYKNSRVPVINRNKNSTIGKIHRAKKKIKISSKKRPYCSKKNCTPRH